MADWCSSPATMLRTEAGAAELGSWRRWVAPMSRPCATSCSWPRAWPPPPVIKSYQTRALVLSVIVLPVSFAAAVLNDLAAPTRRAPGRVHAADMTGTSAR